MLKNVEIKLQVNQTVPPKFQKHPFALKGKVESELESLEAAGIISPVSHLDWAALIILMPVMKQNGLPHNCCNSDNGTYSFINYA